MQYLTGKNVSHRKHNNQDRGQHENQFLNKFSNVPAAMLLSGYTKEIPELIVGTNLGGLGTLIASMASLISYRQITAADASCRKKYILIFTVFNLVFLAILYQIR